jgi:predicted phage terminase large subunit-like protein
MQVIKLKAINEQLKNPAPSKKKTIQPSEEFYKFVGRVNSRFIFYRHCVTLAEVLERVATGEIKRLLIQLPPRHSKSEMVSRLFSAYYLKRNPHHFVGLNSYSAELAYTLSRAAHENYLEAGGIVKDDVSAVKHWETPEGGGMWAAGVGGSITGKGANLALIDDPLKNAEEAASETIREKQKEWYSSTLYTRLEPDAALVIIQTRWHEDDLTGWILSEEKGDEPENWHIVCLPAFYEEMIEFPSTCTVEKDFRSEIGTALCPERYDENKLAKIRARIGEYHFDSLYQQRPIAKSGSFFNVEMFGTPVKAVPVGCRTVRGWDKAATKGDGDYTAGVRMSKSESGIFYIEDVMRGQFDTATRDRLILQTANLDGKGIKQIGEQEPGSAGKESAENFVRMLAGYSVTTEKVSGAKEVRADPFSSQVNAGNVRLVEADWNKAFINELRAFPHGRHDDQVDAASLAFNELNPPEFQITPRVKSILANL